MKPLVWSRIQPHGGTTVPKEIRDQLNLKPGDVLVWSVNELEGVRVRKGYLKEVTQEWPHKTSQ